VECVLGVLKQNSLASVILSVLQNTGNFLAVRFGTVCVLSECIADSLVLRKPEQNMQGDSDDRSHSACRLVWCGASNTSEAGLNLSGPQGQNALVPMAGHDRWIAVVIIIGCVLQVDRSFLFRPRPSGVGRCGGDAGSRKTP
jgi:hypothetical protein